ncbi:MAG: PDZ domain-containing protein [Planctomycetota bacterium]|nr:MAG: PDZ domain-containing protein [Planctomycetota bacterium]
MTSLRFALGSLAPLCAVVWSAAPAQAAPLEGTVTEVRDAKSGVDLLASLGEKAGVRVGQSVEVRRDGKPVGYGSVVQVFRDVAVVRVGTLIGGARPAPGDALLFLAGGFRPGARDEGASAPRSEATPPSPPPAPEGKVVGVRDGVVLLDFGRNEGLEEGHVVELLDDSGEPVGRISVELVGPNSAGGLLQRGRARMGFRARSRGPAPEEPGIDFAALDFLGAVAQIEHRTRYRAPCHLGVPVRRVLAGSPAERAGLGPGDRILAVDGLVVRDIAGVRARIAARRSNTVRVLILRGEQVLGFDVDFSKKHSRK